VEMSLRIEVDAGGAVSHVHAALVPVSNDLYWAVKRETIAKEAVRGIVERDLAKPDQKVAPAISEPGLFATWRAPYVYWGVRASRGGKPPWAYHIDAFTGKILGKNCTQEESFRPWPPGFSPCD